MGGYPQSYHHPQPPTSWGPPPMQQQPGYGYAQPGAYPQYTVPQPPYGGSYPPQPAAWDQASTQGAQQATAQATTGYDYYNQQQQQSAAAPADNAAYGYGQGSYGDAYGYSQPASGYEQSYGSSAPPAYGQAAVNPAQDGSGSGSGPAYAAPGGIAPAASVVQPSHPGYGVSPAQPMYGQAAAPPPPAAQPGYARPYQQAAPPPPYGGPSQGGYGQQQGYGDSYGGAGGYSKPPVYGNEAAGGVSKTSPQS